MSQAAPSGEPSIGSSATPYSTTIRKQMPGGPYEPSDPRWVEVDLKDKIDKAWEWKMPINFYGKVLDQNGQPVADATVRMSWTNISKNGSSQIETRSDSHGNFALENQHGRSLLVNVTKTGFYNAQRQNQDSFDFAAFWEKTYYQPNAKAPVIFHLRKQGVLGNLLTGELKKRVPPDGSPTDISLSQNQEDSWARLAVKAWTNTEEYPPRLFDWRMELRVPGGDIQPCNDEFPFLAPEGKYSPAIEVNMPRTVENWKRVVDQKYYIRYTNPLRYGLIQFRINGASQNVSIAYWIIPTPGDRNLEFDPAKAVTVP